MGDFNEIMPQSEKFGGRGYRSPQGAKISDLIDKAGLINVGNTGPDFTWTYCREGVYLIRKQLARALANAAFLDACLNMKVSHLPRTFIFRSLIVLLWFRLIIISHVNIFLFGVYMHGLSIILLNLFSINVGKREGVIIFSLGMFLAGLPLIGSEMSSSPLF